MLTTKEQIETLERFPVAPGASRISLLVYLAAAALLAVMAVLMFLSGWNDTATSDDNVALVSGYSYLRTQQYRLEPQNPPIIKDLAAFPLLFMKLHEPWGFTDAWGENNDPDQLGREFLFRSGNDADAILRAARTPMILFTVALGAFLFWWTKGEYGAATALLTLFLFCFSPTFLAHGRMIATDVGATAGFVLTLVALLRFLKRPTWANVLLAGLALGFALLTKFSTIALIPIAFLLAAAWVLVQDDPARRRLVCWRRTSSGALAFVLRMPTTERARRYGRYLARTACIVVVAYLVVYVVYLHHVWNYPVEVQVREAQYLRMNYDLHGSARDLVLWASDKPLLRPWAEYFLGLLVALKASSFGQSMFFFGKIYSKGLRAYFPALYLLKEPLALHLLTLIALGFALSRMRVLLFRERQLGPRNRSEPGAQATGRLPGAAVAGLKDRPLPCGRGSDWTLLRLQPLRQWVASHFTAVALALVLAIYWLALIRSNMNIGVRHLLPAFPLTFILVSNQIVLLYRRLSVTPAAAWACRIVLAGLLGWQAWSVLRVHPSYLAYFNELAGGADGGWRYANDSNLDWGQDVKRLAEFTESRGIDKIDVDYFGPSDPDYYLKTRYQGPVGCGELPHGWVALSAMVYVGAPWNPTCDYRQRLPMSKAVAKIGYSIFIFHVD